MRAVRVVLLLFAGCVLARAQGPALALPDLPLTAQERHHTSVPPLTLVQLEASALENNPEIKLAARRVAVEDARVRGAGALDDPSFTYRAWGVPLARPWDLNQPQNMFMFSQAIPGPGKRALRTEIAAHAVDVAKAELEAKKREIAAQVRTAFYQLLLNSEEFRIHDRHVALARQALEAARIRYTVDRAPQQDVLKAQIAFAKLVDHVLMFEQEGQLARARLNTLLGRDPATPLEVAGQYEAPGPLAPIEELERIAMANRPELAAATAAIRQADSQAALAGKAYTPDFSIGGGYMLMPPGSRFRNTYMAEASISLPWLNRRRHESEIAEARARSAAMKAEYEHQRAVVLEEIRAAAVRAEIAAKQARLYRDTLQPQAQSAFQSATAAYQTGRADFLNLLDSQTMTLDVELVYYRALSEYEQRLAELERAIGAPLPRGDENSAAKLESEVRP